MEGKQKEPDEGRGKAEPVGTQGSSPGNRPVREEGEVKMERIEQIADWERGFFPDGTPADPWFGEEPLPSVEDYERTYPLDAYGVLPGDEVQTGKIQEVIDRASEEGGGLLIIPKGRYVSGALFLKEGVDLYVAEGGILSGSEDIRDFPICDTRIEGQSCRYFPALLNIEGRKGVVLFGEGTIDGNGRKYWEEFWLRRDWNPACTNKDAQRPRLVFFSHCTDVLVRGLTLQNSPFWTNHLYKCRFVKYLDCKILSPVAPVKAPSTDAIDIDACTDVVVRRCTMAVNDDAVALKGGKGAWADEAPENGANERIVIEDCTYGFCHGCLTFGSESVHDRNIVFRNVTVGTGYNLLWMKLRPDTPQHYEHVLMENITGRAANFLNIHPWSQFYDLQGREDMPVSLCEHVHIRNCEFVCDSFFHVKADEEHYHLADFCLESLKICATEGDIDESAVEDLKVTGLVLTKKEGIDFPDSVTTIEEDTGGKAAAGSR